MVDIETLGSRTGSEVLSIGAVYFDSKGVSGQFYSTVDCAGLGLTQDEDTLKWWSEQSAEARTILTEVRTPAEFAFKAFNEFVDGRRVWGYGSTFDNMQLRAAFAAAGIKPNWTYRDDVCFRTLRLVGAKFNLPYVRIGTHHNALDDALTQAVAAVQILNRLDVTL